MIFRLNLATVANLSEETKESEMENSTIDKRNHILKPNFETYHSQLQFKQLMALTICQNWKWNARINGTREF